jgi:nucleoside-diphosphate-sugar epimerase
LQRFDGTTVNSPMHLGERDPGRVLVTGARGFLGAAVVARLRASGVEVVASDIGEPGADSSQILSCDVTDFHEVETVMRDGAFSTVLHCGAVSGPMVLAERPLDIWRINSGGTVHVLEAARRYGVGRVVVCSTSEVYGDCTCRVDETTLPRPTTIYGASKLAAEQALSGYVKEHGLDAVALRLSWIYGPGRTTPTTLEKAIRAGAAGQNATMDAGPESPTHYINIDDAVQGLLLAATAGNLESQLYNITAGPAVPMAEVAQLLAQLSDGVTVICEPAANSGLGISHIDNSRAARELGFEIKVHLGEGLALYRDALLDCCRQAAGQ